MVLTSLVQSDIGALRRPWQRYALYFALVFVILLFAAVRFQLRGTPLERDEGEYAYSGQLMLEGIPPYKLAYNMKLPGTYAAYAGIMAMFGQTPSGIRLGVLLVNAATVVLLFLLTKRLHGVETGVLAASTYALLSARSSMLGLHGHSTHFVVLTALAGLLLILYAVENGRATLFFVSGFLLGLAFLMKQHGIFFAVFGGLYALWKLRGNTSRDVFLRTGLFSVGVVLPFAVTCLILYRLGVFRHFWFWTFTYGRIYASQRTLREGREMLRAVGPWIIRPFVIWVIAVIGLLALLWSREVRQEAAFSLGLLSFSALSVLPGFYFRPHYFILILPAVSLWTAIGVVATQQIFCARFSKPWCSAIPLVIFTLAFASAVYGQWKTVWRSDPSKVTQALYPTHDFAEGRNAAEYIKNNSSPQDTLAVLGSEPEIYFYSGRHSATGYIYMYGLIEKQPLASRMQDEMLSEINRGHARFVVLVDDEFSWFGPDSAPNERFFHELKAWIDTHYALKQQIVIQDNAAHQWGERPSLYIYQRRD